jgi:hypothetical protein
MSAGFYDNAVTEYRRFLFFNPADPLASDVYSRIGWCYARMEKWKEAVEAIDKSIQLSYTDSLRYQREVDRAVILIAMGSLDKAQTVLRDVATSCVNRNIKDRANTLLFLSTILGHQWRSALDIYRSKDMDPDIRSDSIEPVLADAAGIRYKSPGTAVILSTFLPGLGQVYCGNWPAGINALVLNAALGYLTVDCIIDEKYVPGFLSFIFLFQRYYFGNREHARQAAVNHNRKLDTFYEKEILTLIRRIDMSAYE